MSVSNRTGKNLLFQTAYQILNTCLPLITAPYLARTLGANQLGVFSYTSSVVAYFSLFAMLGTVNYGTRSIASFVENREKRSISFWEIYEMQVMVTLCSIVLYFLYYFFVCKDNHLIVLIQSLTLVGCLLDINWLFFGCEQFKTTVTRNFFVRMATVVCILLFVKKEDDLWIYTLIMLLGTVISNGILWLYVSRLIDFKIIGLKKILKHVKPNLILFVPILAMSVYHVMDRTMMGLLSTYEQSGYYYNADKIINIPLGILNGVGTVMLPRMTALFEQKADKEAIKLFLLSIEGIIAVGTAITFGISAISPEFTPWFFGAGYEPCILLIVMLSPALLIKGISNTVRTQYLIPLHKEHILTKSVIYGALINLVINILLIPKFGAIGAVIGTVAAELGACVVQLNAICKELYFGKNLIASVIYVLAGLVMLVVVRLISLLPIGGCMLLIIETLAGALTYSVICLTFWKVTKNLMYEDIFLPIIKKYIRVIK